MGSQRVRHDWMTYTTLAEKIVQLSSHVRFFVTPWTVAHQAPLSMGILHMENTGVGCHALFQRIFPTQGSNPGLSIAGGLFTSWARRKALTISQSLPKFMFIALVMPSSHLILWCPFLLLHSIYLSFRDFSSSVHFSHSVVSNSLWLHGLQHSRLPCPSPTPGVYSNLCPLSLWCHATISSFVPFSSCLQSCPASGSFQMSQLFPSGGQSIGVSASGSVLPMNIHDWFPLGWTGWISFLSKGLSGIFSSTTVQRHQFFGVLPSVRSNSHNHWEDHSLDYMDLCWQSYISTF